MKVSEDVARISNEISVWASAFEKEDRPRIQPQEISLLVHYVQQLLPDDIIVEIGTGWGGSAAIFAKAKPPDTHFYTVDSGSNFERFGPKDGRTYDEFIEERFALYGLPGEIAWIRGDSKAILWALPIDLLFVDGAHSYEGVRGDIRNMVQHVVPNGVVVFHDYHMKGVRQAVDEFLAREGLEIENRGGATVAVRVRSSSLYAGDTDMQPFDPIGSAATSS